MQKEAGHSWIAISADWTGRLAVKWKWTARARDNDRNSRVHLNKSPIIEM